jgi:hypothetical protein
MVTNIAAVYENGVLKPSRPLPLPEGARVEITVTSATPAPPARPDDAENPGQRAARMLAAIAAMPNENPAGGPGGAEHDAILYGPPYGK